jgi:hypothetical protein
VGGGYSPALGAAARPRREKRPPRGLPHHRHMIIVRAFLTTEYGQSV